MENQINSCVHPEARLEAAGFKVAKLESDPSTICMLQPDLKIIYCNQAWDRFATENGGLELSRSAIIGTSYIDVVPKPLRPFYEDGLANVMKSGQTWDQDYECSSARLYRLLHMRVFRLPECFLLLVHSLRIERPHGADRPAMPGNETLYATEQGIVTMCCHCRRTRRIGSAEGAVWDWVPEYLERAPRLVSHGLCRVCQAYFYS